MVILFFLDFNQTEVHYTICFIFLNIFLLEFFHYFIIMALRVLILGHSFVRRLEEFSQSEPEWLNLGFDVTKIDVSFIGIGGGTIRGGTKCIINKGHMTAIHNIQPHIVYLQIGGNDLCDFDCKSLTLSQDIMSYAEFLLQGYGVQHVVVGQLLPRFSRRCPADYNYKVCQVNNELIKLCASASNVTFWHHRGFWNDAQSLIGNDGVHLNQRGLLKYSKSVRAGVGVTNKRFFCATNKQSLD